jgi:hypothetical protein
MNATSFPTIARSRARAARTGGSDPVGRGRPRARFLAAFLTLVAGAGLLGPPGVANALSAASCSTVAERLAGDRGPPVACALASGLAPAALSASGEALPVGLVHADGWVGSLFADRTGSGSPRASPRDPLLDCPAGVLHPRPTPPADARPFARDATPPALERIARAGRFAAPSTAPPHLPA